ncbi:hypothetical protein AS890_24585 [Rhizobium anhuiense bv. trifolii]|nr:hypothetical protein AS890_24585 [Rhizobium anhuiense bv. trifolii]
MESGASAIAPAVIETGPALYRIKAAFAKRRICLSMLRVDICCRPAQLFQFVQKVTEGDLRISTTLYAYR